MHGPARTGRMPRAGKKVFCSSLSAAATATVKSKPTKILRGALLAASTAGLASGCSGAGLYERMTAWLDAHCAQASACSMDLAEFASFPWQKMYFFRTGVRQETISQVIGVPYPDYDTVTERFVFVEDGRIAHNEDHYPDYDGKRTRTLVFEAAAGESFFVVERAKSGIDVRVERLGGHVFYHLTPQR